MEPQIKLLKEQATKLGISFSPNIGIDLLKQRILDHILNMDVDTAPTKPQADAPARVDENSIREIKTLEATKLVRIIATPMNPEKTDNEERQGEFVMGSNSVVGTIKKFIPYGYPTHIEQFLLNILEEKNFQQRYGAGKQLTRNVKEFAIQILDPLTPEEVEDLKKMQAIRAESANL